MKQTATRTAQPFFSIQSFSLTLFNFSEYSAQMSPLKGTNTFDNDKIFFFCKTIKGARTWRILMRYNSLVSNILDHFLSRQIADILLSRIFGEKFKTVLFKKYEADKVLIPKSRIENLNLLSDFRSGPFSLKYMKEYELLLQKKIEKEWKF